MMIKSRTRIIPYRQGSLGAKSLADALGAKVLKLHGSTFVPRENDLLINWGNVSFECDSRLRVLNSPNLIRQASNKLLFFGMMREAGHDNIIPPFWTRPDEIPDDAFPIVCRTVLAGHSGVGIVLAASRDSLVPASLYVKYISKKDEYRVHIGKQVLGTESPSTNENPSSGSEGPEAPQGECVIAVQRKARRLDTPDEGVNWKVRNHANGFVFVRGDVNPPTDVLEAARTALLASGLDFGACDIIFNVKQQRAYCLEINTAPGLEGQTVQDYAAYFKSLM